jgi:hypothetical protein
MMPQQLALFPDWPKRYRAIVARAEAQILGFARIPTREQLFNTRRSVRLGWWVRASGEQGGARDRATDAKLEAADEVLLRGGHRFFAAADVGISDEDRLARKRARQQALRLERAAAGLCAACGHPKDREGKTCHKCLRVDQEWRQKRAQRERTAKYLDAECQPLVLLRPARMLPVVGERKDCLNENVCLDELVAACGRQDPQGASCPDDCRFFRARDRREQLELFAAGRSGSVTGW